MNSEDQKMLSEALRFVKDLEVPATALTVELGKRVPDGPLSSMGGAPSMPSGAMWPVCEDQNPMVFLAQVNLAEMPTLEGFPEDGMLQFFVKDEDVFGLFTGEFQVHYYKQTDALERRPAPKVKHTPFGQKLHSDGAIMAGSPAQGQPCFGCWQVDEYTSKLEKAGASGAVFDAMYDAFIKARPSTHYIGGHPDFDQGDVRENEGRDHTVVLFQMGYEQDENGWEVCWGDAGQATFLITPNDLKREDFSKILYNWDCA